MTANRLLLLGSTAVVLSATAGAASAQAIGDSIVTSQAGSTSFVRDRNVSVRQRPRAEYEAVGLHAGGFMIYPRVIATVEHDDNIYASSVNEQDDTIWRVQPELSATSTWSRHMLSAYVRTTFNRFSDHSSENSDEWQAGASGRLDILRSANISGGADFGRFTEPRTSTTTQFASAVPIQFDQQQVYVLGTKEFNRLRLTGRVDYRNYDYHDGRTATGALVEQDDRDRDITILTGRADYAVSPDTAVFVQVSGNWRNYDLKRPQVLFSRDSDGVEVLAGANFELSNVTRGEIGVGYLQQKYDDPAFDQIEGFGARGQLEWFPTQLTTVTFNASRVIEDSGIPGSAGYINTSLGAQIDHELLRNVILTGLLSYGHDDYDRLDRQDKRLRAGVSATYLLNRGVGLTVGYSHSKQDSSGRDSGFDYRINRFGATVTLQY